MCKSSVCSTHSKKKQNSLPLLTRIRQTFFFRKQRYAHKVLNCHPPLLQYHHHPFPEYDNNQPSFHHHQYSLPSTLSSSSVPVYVTINTNRSINLSSSSTSFPYQHQFHPFVIICIRHHQQYHHPQCSSSPTIQLSSSSSLSTPISTFHHQQYTIYTCILYRPHQHQYHPFVISSILYSSSL